MNQTPTLHRQSAGFSLIELMVGMVIGMIAVIVMMQVFSVSEGYKRTTTGGDDAQNNGAIAIYGLQRDIQQSGLGFSTMQVIGCNVVLRSGVTLSAMAPVTINHASIPVGDANTDTVLIAYGTANDASEGDRIEVQTTNNYTLTGFALGASGVSPSFAQGDYVIAQAQTRPTSCTLNLEQVSGLSSSTVTVPTGVSGVANGALFNLGSSPKIRAYAVRSGNLTMCDYMTSNCASNAGVSNPAIWVPVASNVVSLRAEYGRDTSGTMDGTVDMYDQATPTSACGWVRASAVRVALVARSAEFDKGYAAGSPTWSSTAASGVIDLSAQTGWQNYHYKTFQTVVPLRNLAWIGAQAGC